MLTADTHFGHANIIEYAEWPYAVIDEMDADLARRWNGVAGHDDLACHLRDLAMGYPEKWPDCRRRLIGVDIWDYQSISIASAVACGPDLRAL